MHVMLGAVIPKDSLRLLPLQPILLKDDLNADGFLNG